MLSAIDHVLGSIEQCMHNFQIVYLGGQEWQNLFVLSIFLRVNQPKIWLLIHPQSSIPNSWTLVPLSSKKSQCSSVSELETFQESKYALYSRLIKYTQAVAFWYTISLPKSSQAESRSWDKPRTIPDKQFLISLSQLTVEHCDELGHLGSRTSSPTFWRHLCTASLCLSKYYAKLSGYVMVMELKRT